MHVQPTYVTPDIARNYLARSPQPSRPVSRRKVNALKAAFSRGEYMPTHQGIAFNCKGQLVDGRHRLTAIAERPEDEGYPMLVTHGLAEGAEACIDLGSRRTVAQALGEDRHLVSVVTLLAGLLGIPRADRTPARLAPIVDGLREQYFALVASAPMPTRFWSSAPVRLAALIAARKPDGTLVHKAYRALAYGESEHLSTAARNLRKTHATRPQAFTKPMDVLRRMLPVFMGSPSGRAVSPDAVRDHARRAFGHLV